MRTHEDMTAGEIEYRRAREDTTYAGFGTGRPQSEILTAKLTAILWDVGNRQRMSADADS